MCISYAPVYRVRRRGARGWDGCRLPRNERTITLYKQDQKASHSDYQSRYYLSHTDCFILHPRALERMRRAQPRCPRCWRLSAVQANAIRPYACIPCTCTSTYMLHGCAAVCWARCRTTAGTTLGRARGSCCIQHAGGCVAVCTGDAIRTRMHSRALHARLLGMCQPNIPRKALAQQPWALGR